MIDYVKLKLAHELAEKLRIIERCEITITHTFWGDKSDPYILYIGEPDSHKTDGEFDNLNIDDLISKLKELTKSQPKFKIGDTVWCSSFDNKINSITITNIQKIEDIYYYTYHEEGYIIDENICFESCLALIDSKIDYWSQLKEEDECAHNYRYGVHKV